MRNKKFIIIIIAAVSAVSLIVFLKTRKSDDGVYTEKIVTPVRGMIRTVISTTGTVLPQNRLELKPAVNGRVEKILVVEGQPVRIGQILAWMSSTERAALIDAARAQGSSSRRYWEDAYKPIPLVSPINGSVIVRSVEPGQTVTTATPVLVLSDRLIVKADVDETDIGKVKRGQKVTINLDAYPDVQTKGVVDHIYYESQIVNNVTIYKVDILPLKVPAVFRSGMSANLSIVEKVNDNALLVPYDAVVNEDRRNYLFVKVRKDAPAVKREVQVGMSDDQNIEILSGLGENESVAVILKKIQLEAKKSGNPFIPARKKGMGH